MATAFLSPFSDGLPGIERFVVPQYGPFMAPVDPKQSALEAAAQKEVRPHKDPPPRIPGSMTRPRVPEDDWKEPERPKVFATPQDEREHVPTRPLPRTGDLVIYGLYDTMTGAAEEWAAVVVRPGARAGQLHLNVIQPGGHVFEMNVPYSPTLAINRWSYRDEPGPEQPRVEQPPRTEKKRQ